MGEYNDIDNDNENQYTDDGYNYEGNNKKIAMATSKLNEIFNHQKNYVYNDEGNEEIENEEYNENYSNDYIENNNDQNRHDTNYNLYRKKNNTYKKSINYEKIETIFDRLEGIIDKKKTNKKLSIIGINNENSENEKRTHKIVCSIIGSFPIKGYILDEPEVSGFDFNDEKGESTWPKVIEKKIFLIGECGEKKELDFEPLFFGAADDFVSPIKNVRKVIVNKALKSLPARTSVKKDDMKYQMKLAKNKFSLSPVETAYMLYKWEAENIAYDCYNYYHNTKNLDYTEDGAYTKGKGVCNSYSKIFESFGKYLGLEVAFIVGYTKGASYVQGKIPQSTNHAWNAVKIGTSYYLLDATWGSGSCNGDKFSKKLRDSYFCANPYGFIRSHLPPEKNGN
jgi:hypothetical protein